MDQFLNGEGRTPDSIEDFVAAGSRTVQRQKRNDFRNSQRQPRGIETYLNLPAFGLLRHAAEVIPDRTAIVYGSRSYSFESLNHDAVRTAAMLQQIGVQAGDRVAVLLPNVPEFVIAANAIWRAGGIVVALSPLMVEEEVTHLIKSTNCRYVIAFDMLAPLLAGCDSELTKTLYVSILENLPALKQLGYLWMRHQRTGQWLLPEDETHAWFWNEVNATRREWKPVEIDPSTDPAYILPTGGTTGSPKSVTLSHENMVANAWQQFEWAGREFACEKMLAMLPFFHSYGVSAIMMSGSAMGATLVLHHRFNVRKALQLIEQHRITVMHAVPAMLVAMNERLRKFPMDLSSLRWVISGGAPLKAEIGAEFAEHSGALVVEGFGLSESSPVTHVGDLFGEPRYGSIGLPLPETECRIIEDIADNPEKHGTKNEHKDIGNNKVGELVIRGPQVMLGYWNDPQATAEAIRDGWLHTGDLAMRDDDGFFTIVGRRKDLIITNGFNVHPAEVDAVLIEAEGVAEAAVVGVPDPQRGEIVKAFVVMESGSPWNEDALREHCSAHLSRHKRPRVYEQCDELPKNFLGKVIRRKLRDREEEIKKQAVSDNEPEVQEQQS